MFETVCVQINKKFIYYAESDQTTRIAMTRGMTRFEQGDVCSDEHDAHVEAVLNRLHRVLDYFNTLKSLKLNFPLLASRTIQGDQQFLVH